MYRRVLMAILAGGAVTGCRGATEPATGLALSTPVEHVEKLAREPMIVEHPDGTLFVTGYGEPLPILYKSTDKGATWTSVAVGTIADGAVGNSDVDLAVAPDGTLYFIAMTFDRTTFEGTQISIGSSRDAGATWSWSLLSKTRYDDRPWVEVAPDGVAHAIWNDGSGVAYAVSRDRGLTWTEQPRIHDQGGSSHLAIGPAGEIAVRISPVSASANVSTRAWISSRSAPTAARAGPNARCPACVSGRSHTAMMIKCHDGWSLLPGTPQDGSIFSGPTLQGCTWRGPTIAARRGPRGK